MGLGAKIGIVIVGVVALGVFGKQGWKAAPEKAVAPITAPTPVKTQPPAASLAAAKPEPEIDRDTKAMYACKTVIERSAKYDFRWKNERWNPFPRSSVDSKGHVTFTGDDAEAQNGFGNWSRVTYSCKWDPKTMVIIAVGIQAGRLK